MGKSRIGSFLIKNCLFPIKNRGNPVCLRVPLGRGRLAVVPKSRISRISRKHIGKSRIGSPLIKNCLPPIKISGNPACVRVPLGRGRLAVVSKSRISRISRKHIGKSRIRFPWLRIVCLQSRILAILFVWGTPWVAVAWQSWLEWSNSWSGGSQFLIFLCVFLKFLKFLIFGTTARRPRPEGTPTQRGLSDILIGGRQFLIRGEAILDFPMCFLEILDILDFWDDSQATATQGDPHTKRIVIILDWR